MSLQCGIVGLPNVGKSTLFNALTSAKAEAANYPFCTIDPNVGVVVVPDSRLDKIAKIAKPLTIVPTTIEFVDIAGLVAGASQGEGLGNQFLGHIRQTDAIVHVARCFEEDNVVHVSGSVDPLRDIDVINTELLLADLNSIEQRYRKIEKGAQSSQDRKLKEEFHLISRIYQALKEGKPARQVSVEPGEELLFRTLHLLTAKPTLYVCNVGEKVEGNDFVGQVKARAAEENSEVVLISCAIEAEIAQLPPEERSDFLASLNMSEPGLHRLIVSAYQLLNLQTYFTAGEKEVRAWTIAKGTKAPQAAGVIHSDFEKGFIRAEVYHCDDLFAKGSELAVKEAGLMRSEGKEYVVKDGDVCLFRFNV